MCLCDLSICDVCDLCASVYVYDYDACVCVMDDVSDMCNVCLWGDVLCNTCSV